jgi:hypothetical protein
MRNILTVMSALAVASSPAFALESATTGGSQATQATVGAINSKVDTSVAALQTNIAALQANIAALQARLDKIAACEAQKKLYVPADSSADANGCVSVGGGGMAGQFAGVYTGSSILNNPQSGSRSCPSGSWGMGIPYPDPVNGTNTLYICQYGTTPTATLNPDYPFKSTQRFIYTQPTPRQPCC